MKKTVHYSHCKWRLTLAVATVSLLLSCQNRGGQTLDAGDGTAQGMDSVEWQRKTLAELRLDSLLKKRNFPQALLLLDSLQRAYPGVPTYHFSEGWVHDMQCDSVSARTCYERACSIYDSLIDRHHRIGDQVNRLLLTNLLHGPSVCEKEGREILHSASPADSAAVAPLVGHLCREPFDAKGLFQGDSNVPRF